MRSTALVMAVCALMAGGGGASVAQEGVSQPAVQTALTDKLSQGKAVFDQWCAGCHGPLPGPGRFPPAGTYRLKLRYKEALPAALEDRVDLTPGLIRTAVRRGFPIMPPIRKTEVTDSDLDLVVAYLTRNEHK